MFFYFLYPLSGFFLLIWPTSRSLVMKGPDSLFDVATGCIVFEITIALVCWMTGMVYEHSVFPPIITNISLLSIFDPDRTRMGLPPSPLERLDYTYFTSTQLKRNHPFFIWVTPL